MGAKGFVTVANIIGNPKSENRSFDYIILKHFCPYRIFTFSYDAKPLNSVQDGLLNLAKTALKGCFFIRYGKRPT